MASEPAKVPLTERVAGFCGSDQGQRVLLVAFSVAASAILVLFPGGALAYAFGLPMVFFVPGVAVARLFFWKGTTVEAKFVLSLGLSILSIIMLGLVLVFTVGLRSETAIGSLMVFGVAAVALETFWLHADREPGKSKGSGTGANDRPVQDPIGKDEPQKMDKVVAAMVASALVVSGIAFGLIVTAHYPSRTYFAITDAQGNANINRTVYLNTNLSLLLHVKNGEGGPRDFTIEFHEQNGSGFANRSYASSVGEGGYWNQTVVLPLDHQGVYRLDFDLFIAEPTKAPEFYANLHIWINVV